MRLAHEYNGASALLSTALALALLISSVDGQLTGAPNLSTASSIHGNTNTAAATSAPSASASASGGQVTGSPSNSATQVVITGSSVTGTATQSVPSLVTASQVGLTGLPKLANGYTIPTAAVPDTANAPFMQASNLPEGTIFIAVGAFLGFLAFTVMAWRGLTAWTLHRSVKRASADTSAADKKTLFRTIAPPMYNYHDGESKASLGNFGGGRKKPNFGASAMASAQSLFFSPTAGAASAGLGTAGNRTSSYLPAGYYAAGASSAGNGAGTAHIGGNPDRESISLSNIVPKAQGYGRPGSHFDHSPPDSPGFPATTLGHNANMSASTLDLGRLPNGRAPSAVLDDLFDGTGEPVPGSHPGPRRY